MQASFLFYSRLPFAGNQNNLQTHSAYCFGSASCCKCKQQSAKAMLHFVTQPVLSVAAAKHLYNEPEHQDKGQKHQDKGQKHQDNAPEHQDKGPLLFVEAGLHFEDRPLHFAEAVNIRTKAQNIRTKPFCIWWKHIYIWNRAHNILQTPIKAGQRPGTFGKTLPQFVGPTFCFAKQFKFSEEAISIFF